MHSYLKVGRIPLLKEFLLVEEAGNAEEVLPHLATLLILAYNQAAVVSLHTKAHITLSNWHFTKRKPQKKNTENWFTFI
jgi:hypothetical protein